MISYKEFTNKYYPSANDIRLKDIERFLCNLEKLIGNTPEKQALTNKQLLCNAFYLQKTGNNISRSHYQKIKEYFVNIFDFIGIQSNVPTRDEVLNSREDINYFGSLEKALQFIDEVGYGNLKYYDSNTDLIRVKAICILGWMGFSLNEISHLQNNDLIKVDNNIFKISNKREIFELKNELYTIFHNLQTLTQYSSLPTGKFVYLNTSSKYLLRPTGDNCDKIDSNCIVQILKRFNAAIPKDIKTSIIFRNLHKNALFLKIYESKPNDNNLIKTITEVIGCERTYAYSYKDQYLKFADAMDNKKI